MRLQLFLSWKNESALSVYTGSRQLTYGELSEGMSVVGLESLVCSLSVVVLIAPDATSVLSLARNTKSHCKVPF